MVLHLPEADQNTDAKSIIVKTLLQRLGGSITHMREHKN